MGKSILIGIALVIIASIGVFIYQGNKPEPEPNITYVMPEYKDTAKVEAEIVPPNPLPTPEPSYNDFVNDIIEGELENLDTARDEEVEEFLDLVKLAMKKPVGTTKEPTDMMKLSPDEMLEYFDENLTHREQHDFLMSSDGEDWIRHAFDAPPIQAPNPDECREQHPNDVFAFNGCMEEQYRVAIAPYRSQLTDSVERLMNFYSQLAPEVFSFSRNDVGVSIIEPAQPPEALIESDF